MNKKRCEWVEGKEDIYIKYHDEEWGVPLHDDRRQICNKQACGIVNDHGSDCPRYHEIIRDYPTVRKRRDRES